MNGLNILLGSVVVTKKNHACGGNLFEVVRVGADIKLKCQKCGHIILVDKLKAENIIKEFKVE